MIDQISKNQLSLILKSKNYLSECRKKAVEISSSPFCDLNSWNNSLGYQKLLLLKDNKFFSFSFFWYLMIEILNVGRFKFQIFDDNQYNLSLKKKIIIYSYCWKDSFDKNFIFYDKYLNLNSNDKKYYFLLVSLDDYVPEKLENISIISRKKTFFNPIVFFKYFFSKFFEKNFFHKFNSTNIFCDFISEYIKKKFIGQKISMIIPYENRPHQNAALNAVKVQNNRNKTICYLHNMPWPFQIDMIYKKNKIDILFTSSHIQKKVLIKNYLWPKKTVQVIPSLRFDKLKKRENTIFLPFDWTEDQSLLLKNFENLINEKGINLKHYEVSIHPLKLNSKIHINFKKKILQIIQKSKNIKNKKKYKFPIIFSHPGGTLAECLQTSNCAYHITFDKLNIFSKSIWKKIIVKEEIKNIYKYSSKIKFFEIKNKKYSLQRVVI